MQKPGLVRRKQHQPRFFIPVNEQKPDPVGSGFSDCQKRPLAFFDKRIAVCCAHSLSAYGGQLAHLQPVRYFLPGTRPGRK